MRIDQYVQILEQAVRSASSHVYRQREIGKHEQDRIDAQRWMDEFGALSMDIVQGNRPDGIFGGRSPLSNPPDRDVIGALRRRLSKGA